MPVPLYKTMIMSNFISEDERHEELYAVYSIRHEEILNIFNKIKASIYSRDSIFNSLIKNGVNEDEIEWLKRTGHYLPEVN